MHVNIIIPTLDRKKWLRKTVDSIMRSKYQDFAVFIVVDGNPEMLEVARRWDKKTAIIYNEKRLDWPKSVVKAIQISVSDAVLYAADDIEFEPECLGNAVRCMKRRFPDGDGVVGLNQKNIRHGCKAAFALVGRKFIEQRFPNRQIFFPLYKHFSADAEFWRFSEKVRRFHHCTEARVYHQRFEDRTRKVGRKHRASDLRIKNWRKKRGLYWGQNFRLEVPK